MSEQYFLTKKEPKALFFFKIKLIKQQPKNHYLKVMLAAI